MEEVTIKVKVLVETSKEGWVTVTASNDSGQLTRTEGRTEDRALRKLCRLLEDRLGHSVPLASLELSHLKYGGEDE